MGLELIDPNPFTIAPRPTRAPKRPTPLDFHARLQQAVMFKAAAFSAEDIALNLAADPKINVQGVSRTGGYGWVEYLGGKPPPPLRRLAMAVVADLDRANRLVVASLAETSQRELLYSLQRCDAVVRSMYPLMNGGSHWHAKRVLEAEERRSKLWGWDSERRVVDATVDATVTQADTPAVHPDYTPEFIREMVEAMAEANIISPDEAQFVTRSLPEGSTDDVIEVESEEVTA